MAAETYDAVMERLRDKGEDPLTEPYLFNVDCTKKRSHPMRDRCFCLLRSSGQIWISTQGRLLNLRERCRLQGMNPEKLKQPRGVSDRQWHLQLGNAMSVNVVERLLARLLPAAGLTGELRDRWASGEALAELKATRACEGF